MKCKIIYLILFATMLLLSGFFITSCEKEVEGVTEIIFTNVRSGKVSLSVGEELAVKYLVMPEHLQETAEIDWETSDRKVARVRKGVIEAEGPGEATITATSGKAKAVILVTVKAVQVEDLDFPSEAIEVYLGATVEVSFKNVTPADASLTTVEWEVKDYGNGDATVEADDDCIYITGTEKGVAELYGYIDGQEIGHQEIVINERIPVESVSVTLSKQTVQYGESLTVSPYVQPSDASLKDVTITCTPSNLATVSGNTITAGNQAGKVTVRATADGVSGTAEFEIVPPPLELSVSGDFGENNGTFLSPDGSVRSFQKTAQLSLKTNYDVDLSEVEWTSSNPAVATVDKNGLVTAAGHGWTDITAKVTTIHGEGTGSLRVRSVKGSSLAFKTKRYDWDFNEVETLDMSTPKYQDFCFEIVETTFAGDTDIIYHDLLFTELGITFRATSSDPSLLVSITTYEPFIVWLKADTPMKQSAKVTLTSNYGQTITVNSRINIGSVSLIGNKTDRNYATLLNGGKANVTIPTGSSAESVIAFINVGDSYDPVTSIKIDDRPYHNGQWKATQNGSAAQLPFDGARLLSTSSKERVISTTALGGFSFTLSSGY